MKNLLTNRFMMTILGSACLIGKVWCAEPRNNSVGPIDKLMLGREIKERGAGEIEIKIMQQPMEMRYKGHRLPFTVSHTIQNDGSELSQAIFNCIENNITVVSNNVYNQNLNAIAPNVTPIDHCTCLINRPEPIGTHACATFFDKPMLIALFKELTQ
jgi:hypothetical protein